MSSMTPGRKFMELFSGLDRAHGLGVGRIEKTPPTEALFKWHLEGGGSGLGPTLAGPYGSCSAVTLVGAPVRADESPPGEVGGGSCWHPWRCSSHRRRSIRRAWE